MLQILPFLFSALPVVGGAPVKPGVYPDAVAVLANDAACTGTLIAPDVVLTAGHCIETDPVLVIVDTVDYGAPGGEKIRVKSAHAYPDWEHTYDVGVVILERAATTKPRAIAAACTVSAELANGAEVHVVGFGLTTKSGTGSNSQLHEGVMPVTDATCGNDPACEPAVAPGGEFAAGGNGVDSCFGDSGGPVYLATQHGPALVGVVSRGHATAGAPCATGGIYVRADKVVPWIEGIAHEKLARTSCHGAGDESEPGDEGGGCDVGGAAGLPLALAALWVVTRRNRR